jgi:hypothetical protein
MPSFEPAVAALVDALDADEALPVSVEPGGWLHALVALDRL